MIKKIHLYVCCLEEIYLVYGATETFKTKGYKKYILNREEIGGCGGVGLVVLGGGMGEGGQRIQHFSFSRFWDVIHSVVMTIVTEKGHFGDSPQTVKNQSLKVIIQVI